MNTNEKIKNSVKPILFSTPMVHSILDGRKTQTRRQIKFDFTKHYLPNCNDKIEYFLDGWGCKRCGLGHADNGLKPKYQKNDILWVRETFCQVIDAYTFEDKGFKYRADENTKHYNGSWKPSIFMPKEAARIFLKVTNVRVEKLQDISNTDAIAEGIIELWQSQQQKIQNGRLFFNYLAKKGFFNDGLPPKESFKSLWQKINGNWDKNPYVWVYEFEKTSRPENF